MNFPSRTARRVSSPSVDPLASAARAAAIAEQQLDVIWRMARRLGVPDCDIEDVAQEVLIVVVRREDYIEVGKERAFVASVTARVVANWRRTRRRRREDPSDELESIAGMRLSGAFGALDAEQSLERSRQLGRLERALDEMTEAQREAFTLFDLEQLTAPEIAEQLGVPEAAIVSRVRRAREVFKRALGGETRSPRRVAPNVEEAPRAERPIGPGSTLSSPRSGGDPGQNSGREELAREAVPCGTTGPHRSNDEP
ncbi:MAG TPA: sigma-70 family RNA polymerase sigma factor [Polyangiaceae bacterium]|nr:sigma-70 family RNA polymerase sigma factor [Polyangiaceae bacterium]